MKLTQKQLNFFETFGFLAFPGLFLDDIENMLLKMFGHVTEVGISAKNTTEHRGQL